jgi:hypothetical protein
MRTGLIASIIRMKRISEPRTLAVTSNVSSLITTWRHIPEDGIHHSHRRENLKPLIGWSL